MVKRIRDNLTEADSVVMEMDYWFTNLAAIYFVLYAENTTWVVFLKIGVVSTSIWFILKSLLFAKKVLSGEGE